MKRLRTLFLAPAAAALAAAAVAGAAGPALTISASPFSLKLQGAATSSIHVVNPGSHPVSVQVSTGDLAVSQTGKISVDPKKRPALSARSWLAVSPGRLTLPAGGVADVSVVTHPPTNAAPGDHYALVLLTTVPPNGVQVGVRTRIGVSVIDTVAGAVAMTPKVAHAAAVKIGKRHLLQLRIVNRSAFVQRLTRGMVTLDIRRGAKRLAHLVAPARVLLPHSTALVSVPYPKAIHGTFTVTTKIGTATRRFRLRL